MPLTKAKIRELQNLGRKKDREATGLFVVDGVRGVQEAVRSQFPIQELYYTEQLLAGDAGEALLKEASTRVRTVQQLTPREMEQVSDTVTAQGVLAVVKQMHWGSSDLLRGNDGRSLIVALDAVADPGNLGSIVRTCDWFGVDAIVLGRNCVELYNTKVVRSTVGSMFHLPILTNVDLAPVLLEAKQCSYAICATTASGASFIDEAHYASKVVVVLGNEAWGVSDAVMALADTRLAVRRYGSAESLNVGIACGVILASIRNQR
jgi:RNA methyltransferase, TrmH family